MTQPRRVILSQDLGEFFRNEVSEAKQQLRIEMSEVLEYYLVNLLCEFSRERVGPKPGDEPLALQYKRALEARLAERVQILKDLGDEALYVSGFFAAFVERSLVDLNYYISMGGSAYQNLSELMGGQRHGETFAELYEQLARKFAELVDLLNEISEKARDKSVDPTELMRLYDRWLRTGSQRARKVLLERGMLTHRPPTEFTD
ncbi:MAG: hypothetical protein HYZ27_06865 [Deltaproteobacteria bacterium]|nr:hypothetical protein [Deltaproteobacteria bacterium]